GRQARGAAGASRRGGHGRGDRRPPGRHAAPGPAARRGRHLRAAHRARALSPRLAPHGDRARAPGARARPFAVGVHHPRGEAPQGPPRRARDRHRARRPGGRSRAGWARGRGGHGSAPPARGPARGGAPPLRRGVPDRAPARPGHMPRRGVAGTDARIVAHEVLVRVETTDAFADVLLADRLARAPRRAARLAHAADQALATRLVYGTLAWQGRLDHHLKGLVRMPVADLDPPVRAALRLGLYQLLFLDRVPAYAAVDASAGRARCVPTVFAPPPTLSVPSSRRRAWPRSRAPGRPTVWWSRRAPRACARSPPGATGGLPSRARPRSSSPRCSRSRPATGSSTRAPHRAGRRCRRPRCSRGAGSWRPSIAARAASAAFGTRRCGSAPRASRPRSATPAARPSHVPSTPCWWTRRAAGSARSAGTRSYAGGGARRTSRTSPRSSGR